MLTSVSPSRLHGFTLVEVMFAIVVLAILATLAMPSLQSIIRNAELRNGAEAVLNGLQKARAEAVARNTNVSFVLAADTSWTVAVVNPSSVIERRYASEGSKNVIFDVLPAGTTTITFNNLGQVAANADGTNTLREVDLATFPADRSLRVAIGISGSAKMCDPGLPSTDPRAC